ncbi:H(+)/Cl(-) exchange transporter ClcA [Amorphus orientalis]|uniref:CIC family chloride channel protein n=1 Tax=Amorphus orientalis TaxID=649198 RepID=A0AAE3VPW8_9HYPH|nr:H(+)/Cl(-) exchange transporter ClcA [Amorphus orientalis]MDQ0315922.1 CIC family chloride channel protein [Amorphus orientalis]
MTEQASPPRTSDARFYLLACALGILTGAIGTLFHLAADQLLAWHRTMVAGPPTAVSIGLAAGSTCAMVVAAVYLVRRFAPEAAGSGVQEIEGALEGLRPLRWKRVLPVKFFGGLLSIGSGLVVGREGPTIHIGASIAAGLSDMARPGLVERRGLYAAGAAAGLAAAFNAPLAAVLFVIEETRTQFPYTFRTYMGVAIAATLSTVLTEEMAGMGPDLAISVPGLPPHYLIAFAGLGAVLGLFGYVFNRLLLWSLDGVLWIGRTTSPYLFPAVWGLLIGALIVVFPSATEGGEALILDLVQENWTVAGLFLLVALRLATTMGSYASGAPGGIFAPILTMATCTGLALGSAVSVFMPEAEHLPVAFAIAAMGGLFTSTVRAPMVGVVLVLELTGSFELLLPVLATCIVSNIVAERLGGRPVYEQLLERTLRLAGTPRPDEPGEHLPVQLGWDGRRND